MKSPTSLAAFLLAACLPFAAQAQSQPPAAGTFEEPPTLAAEAILRPEFLRGAHFTVRSPVPTYAGRNQFTIDSDFGIFEAEGNTQLVQRASEIEAIAQLREVSRTDEYKKALAKAAQSPVAMAKNLAKDPVGTVSGVPKGVWKFMNRTGQTIKEVGQKRERSAYEDNVLEDTIGFSKAKRELAAKLAVDPYSANATLQKDLNGIAWASYGGSMTLQVALAPVSGGASVAITAFNVSDASIKALVDLSPTDLRRANLEKLLALGLDRAQANAFLNNRAFSPTHQTLLTNALSTLRGVAGLDTFLDLTTEAADDSDALFYQRTAALIARMQRETPLAELASYSGLPVALAQDGTLFVPLEWDYASWTERAAQFIRAIKGGNFGARKITGWQLVLTGVASPRAKEELAALGIRLIEKALPGPLQ
jgi:hypothetical protein